MQLIHFKSFWQVLVVWFAAGSAVANLGAASVGVELNGLCNILGDRRAVLVVSPEAGAQNIVLAEGESFGEIKLIAVDMATRQVLIDNGGQTQTLRLCGTPSLSPFADASGQTERYLAHGLDGMVGSLGADGKVAETSPGNPGWGTLPMIAAANSAAKKPSAAATQPAAPSAGDSGVSPIASPANPANTQPDTEWYQESESLEQNRRETAAQVLAGEMEPWPRTPLTPAGTPAALVGKELFFSSHVPGYVVPGSLN